MQTEVLTETEALAEIARLRSLLDAQAPVVEAAIANTEAVQKWRAATYATPAPGQSEQRRIMNQVDETRAKLIEAVEDYKNAKVMARCEASMARLAEKATLQASSRA
jgi:hypothetical protein